MKQERRNSRKTRYWQVGFKPRGDRRSDSFRSLGQATSMARYSHEHSEICNEVEHHDFENRGERWY